MTITNGWMITVTVAVVVLLIISGIIYQKRH